MKRIMPIVLAALSFVPKLSAQTAEVISEQPSHAMRHSDQLTSYDGLGYESVFDFYKDKTGQVWLATNRGVRSYNGHTI